MRMQQVLDKNLDTVYTIEYTYNNMQRYCVESALDFIKEMSMLGHKEMAYVIERASFKKFNN